RPGFMEAPLIEVQKLTKRFEGRTVLDRVSFKLFKGQVISIIGKSGVGKSVLLKHIVGLLQPDAGRILFRGESIHEMNRKQHQAYLDKISYMFQNNALFSSLSVFDNVALPLRYRRGMGRKAIEQRVHERLAQMELQGTAGQYPAQLSGGMQKRVALARALISEPDIVLFDEPTTGQDPIRKNAILSMIAAYQNQYNFSAILISHDLPDIFFISNTILALYEGRIIFDGSADQFDQFDHPFRTEFTESLELLQQELSGLYSRRQFKLRYQTDLYQGLHDVTYSLVMIRLARSADVIRRLGHSAAQELLTALGRFISRRFSEVGGFAARFERRGFVVLLPHANHSEARRLVGDFSEALNTSGLDRMKRLAPAERAGRDAVKITIAAGTAQGKPKTPIEQVIEAARTGCRPIAELKVQCREKNR
ncbi:MAG: ATP-binding cassette domain-containing protein, partial [Desulfobacterales bacterium]